MENHRTKILGFAFLLAGLALCAVGLRLLLGPAQYQAAARVNLNIGSEPGCIEPDFIEIEFECIQSQVVLSNVVEALKLNAKWSSGDGQLKSAETLGLLKRRVTVCGVPNNPYLIEIRATSEDPNEAAKIANAVAEAYREYRLKQRRQLIQNGIEILTEQYRQDVQQIKLESEKVEELRKKLSVPNPEPADEQLKTNYPAYFDARQTLKNNERFLDLFGKKIEQTKSELNQPPPSTIEIVEAATPPASPNGPDRVLSALLFAIGLFPTAGGFLLLKASLRPSG